MDALFPDWNMWEQFTTGMYVFICMYLYVFMYVSMSCDTVILIPYHTSIDIYIFFIYFWVHLLSTDSMGAALRLDALRSSHPIQVPIGRAEEVEQVNNVHNPIINSYVNKPILTQSCIYVYINMRTGL